MSKELFGDVKAHIPGQGGRKTQYVTVGVAFRDIEDGRISFKIDALPIDGSGWSGWLNVFERDADGAYKKSTRDTPPPPPSRQGPPRAPHEDLEDDIPF